MLAADEATIAAARRASQSAGLLQTRRAIAPFRRISLLRMVAAPPDAEPISIGYVLLPAALERDVLSRATRVALGRLSLPVVTAEDLVLLKLLRSSAQDLVDIRSVASKRQRLLSLRRALPNRKP